MTKIPEDVMNTARDAYLTYPREGEDEWAPIARAIMAERERSRIALSEAEQRADGWAFSRGGMVRKKSGSWWEGCVVGFYSTEQTPRGYAVQLDKPFGPVQIYPESALERLIPSEPHDAEGRE